MQQGANAVVRGDRIGLTVRLAGDLADTCDVAAFVGGADGKAHSDGDMVFFNQPTHGSGAVRLTVHSAGVTSFEVEPARLPATVGKLIFCVAIGEAQTGSTLAQLCSAAIEVRHEGQLLTFAPEIAAATERSMMLGELYRRGAEWKFRAVGQGSRDGLAGIARRLGLEVAQEAPAPAPPLSAPAPPAFAEPPRPAIGVQPAAAPPPVAAPSALPVAPIGPRAIELGPRGDPPPDPFAGLVPDSREAGLGRAFKALGIVWAAMLLPVLLLAMFGLGWLGMILLLLATAYLAVQAFALFTAKTKALRSSDVAILKGWAKLVSWNPNEGVVFLKNKRVAFFTEGFSSAGGIDVIFPILGEEVAFRTSIETRQMDFEDRNVPTLEAIQLSVRTKIYWKVANAARFYLRFGRENQAAHDYERVHRLSDSKEAAARSFILAIAEEETRILVAQMSAGLLMSDQLMRELNAISRPDIAELSRSLSGGSNIVGISTILTNHLARCYNERLTSYGIEIERVALQEMSVPPAIYAAMQEALKAATVDVHIAQAQARARQIQLEADASVIGRDAVALREIASNLPALAFQDLLGPTLLQFRDRRTAVLG